MHEIEGELTDPSIYRGELYLELHRGTLTNQHVTKRNNRKAENSLHNAEFALVRHAVCTNTASISRSSPNHQSAFGQPVP
ncbi:MAG: hypothetical protein ACLS3U_02030 [Lachnospiraceae bacterium]